MYKSPSPYKPYVPRESFSSSAKPYVPRYKYSPNTSYDYVGVRIDPADPKRISTKDDIKKYLETSDSTTVTFVPPEGELKHTIAKDPVSLDKDAWGNAIFLLHTDCAAPVSVLAVATNPDNAKGNALVDTVYKACHIALGQHFLFKHLKPNIAFPYLHDTPYTAIVVGKRTSGPCQAQLASVTPFADHVTVYLYIPDPAKRAEALRHAGSQEGSGCFSLVVTDPRCDGADACNSPPSNACIENFTKTLSIGSTPEDVAMLAYNIHHAGVKSDFEVKLYSVDMTNCLPVVSCETVRRVREVSGGINTGLLFLFEYALSDTILWMRQPSKGTIVPLDDKCVKGWNFDVYTSDGTMKVTNSVCHQFCHDNLAEGSAAYIAIVHAATNNLKLALEEVFADSTCIDPIFKCAAKELAGCAEKISDHCESIIKSNPSIDPDLIVGIDAQMLQILDKLKVLTHTINQVFLQQTRTPPVCTDPLSKALKKVMVLLVRRVVPLYFSEFIRCNALYTGIRFLSSSARPPCDGGAYYVENHHLVAAQLALRLCERFPKLQFSDMFDETMRPKPSWLRSLQQIVEGQPHSPDAMLARQYIAALGRIDMNNTMTLVNMSQDEMHRAEDTVCRLIQWAGSRCLLGLNTQDQVRVFIAAVRNHFLETLNLGAGEMCHRLIVRQRETAETVRKLTIGAFKDLRCAQEKLASINQALGVHPIINLAAASMKKDDVSSGLASLLCAQMENNKVVVSSLSRKLQCGDSVARTVEETMLAVSQAYRQGPSGPICPQTLPHSQKMYQGVNDGQYYVPAFRLDSVNYLRIP
jgi:hypothetical protein